MVHSTTPGEPDQTGGPAGEHERIHIRLSRMEEMVMFTDHTVGQLGDHFAELSRQVEALSRQMAALQNRLDRLAAGSDQAGPAAEASDDSPGPDGFTS